MSEANKSKRALRELLIHGDTNKWIAIAICLVVFFPVGIYMTYQHVAVAKLAAVGGCKSAKFAAVAFIVVGGFWLSVLGIAGFRIDVIVGLIFIMVGLGLICGGFAILKTVKHYESFWEFREDGICVCYQNDNPKTPDNILIAIKPINVDGKEPTVLNCTFCEHYYRNNSYMSQKLNGKSMRSDDEYCGFHGKGRNMRRIKRNEKSISRPHPVWCPRYEESASCIWCEKAIYGDEGTGCRDCRNKYLKF